MAAYLTLLRLPGSHKENTEAFIETTEAGQSFEIDGVEVRKAVEIVSTIYADAKKGKQYEF